MSPHNTIVSVATARAAITEQDWNNHKDLMKPHVYISQDMRLKNLMDVIRTKYGFYATVKMYKSYFATRHFTKNNNLKDMRTAARIMVRDKNKNTAQRYRISGRFITAEEVARYFRRKGFKSLEDAIEHEESNNSTSASVEDTNALCNVAARVDDVPRSSEGRPLLLIGEPRAKIAVKEDAQVNRSLPLIGARYTFTSADELVLRMVEVYYTGCCERDLWYTCTAGRFRTRRPVFDAATILDRFNRKSPKIVYRSSALSV